LIHGSIQDLAQMPVKTAKPVSTGTVKQVEKSINNNSYDSKPSKGGGKKK